MPPGAFYGLDRGATASPAAEEAPCDDVLTFRLAELMESGISERDAVRQCAVELRLPKRMIYAKALEMKGRD